MQVPILKQGQYLVASVQSALTDADWLQLRHDLAQMARQHRSREVILDVTALEVMDSFATRTLRAAAQTLRLRGARAVVVGVQPGVAFSMVQLGLRLEGVETALDLEEGLALLSRPAEEGTSHAR
jgi:rsbT antagonist protein RsbS